jgi:hypothetical protein
MGRCFSQGIEKLLATSLYPHPPHRLQHFDVAIFCERTNAIMVMEITPGEPRVPSLWHCHGIAVDDICGDWLNLSLLHTK